MLNKMKTKEEDGKHLLVVSIFLVFRTLVLKTIFITLDFG